MRTYGLTPEREMSSALEHFYQRDTSGTPKNLVMNEKLYLELKQYERQMMDRQLIDNAPFYPMYIPPPPQHYPYYMPYMAYNQQLPPFPQSKQQPSPRQSKSSFYYASQPSNFQLNPIQKDEDPDSDKFWKQAMLSKECSTPTHLLPKSQENFSKDENKESSEARITSQYTRLSRHMKEVRPMKSGNLKETSSFATSHTLSEAAKFELLQSLKIGESSKEDGLAKSKTKELRESTQHEDSSLLSPEIFVQQSTDKQSKSESVNLPKSRSMLHVDEQVGDNQESEDVQRRSVSFNFLRLESKKERDEFDFQEIWGNLRNQLNMDIEEISKASGSQKPRISACFGDTAVPKLQKQQSQKEMSSEGSSKMGSVPLNNSQYQTPIGPHKQINENVTVQKKIEGSHLLQKESEGDLLEKQDTKEVFLQLNQNEIAQPSIREHSLNELTLPAKKEYSIVEEIEDTDDLIPKEKKEICLIPDDDAYDLKLTIQNSSQRKHQSGVFSKTKLKSNLKLPSITLPSPKYVHSSTFHNNDIFQLVKIENHVQTNVSEILDADDLNSLKMDSELDQSFLGNIEDDNLVKDSKKVRISEVVGNKEYHSSDSIDASPNRIKRGSKGSKLSMISDQHHLNLHYSKNQLEVSKTMKQNRNSETPHLLQRQSNLIKFKKKAKRKKHQSDARLDMTPKPAAQIKKSELILKIHKLKNFFSKRTNTQFELNAQLSKMKTMKSEMDLLGTEKLEEKFKKQRTDQLWGVAKKHVKKIRMVVFLRGIQKRGSIKNQSGELTFEEDKNLMNMYTDVPTGQIWSSLIQLESFSYTFWHFLLSLLMAFIIINIPFHWGSQETLFFVMIKGEQAWLRTVLGSIGVLDIFFNILAEQQVNDTAKTTTIRDTMRFYCYRRFLVDLIAAIPLVFLAFLPMNTLKQVIVNTIYYKFFIDKRDMLDSQGLEVVEELKWQDSEWGAAANNIENLMEFNQIGGRLYWYILMAKYFVLFKFFNLDRLQKIQKVYSRLSLPKQFLFASWLITFLKLIFILFKLVIVIHFITAIWMHGSEFVTSKMQTFLVDYLRSEINGTHPPDENLEELNLRLKQVYGEQFYLITLTLTVVGTGDAVSMPDLQTYKVDYKQLLFCMLLGFLGFQQFQVQLSGFLVNIRKIQLTLKAALLELNTSLEQFFIAHNMLKGVKKFQNADIDVLKDQAEIQFNCNFDQVTKSPFFEELTPILKKKLLHVLIIKEMTFFKFFFFEFVKIGDSNSYFRQCFSHNLIFEFLRHIELQQVSTSESNFDTRMLIRHGQEFKYFYMIKRGKVICYTHDSQNLFQLEQESFFGELNILFGLYTQINYQAVQDLTDRYNQCQMFKIEKDQFMKIITSEPEAFRQVHNVSLQKLRFQQKILSEFRERSQKDKIKRQKMNGEFNLKGRPTQKSEIKQPKFIKLLDVLDMRVPKFLELNPEVAQFYSDLKVKRKIKLAQKKQEEFIKQQQDTYLKKKKQFSKLVHQLTKQSSEQQKKKQHPSLLYQSPGLNEVTEEISGEYESEQSNSDQACHYQSSSPIVSSESEGEFLEAELRINNFFERDYNSSDVDSDDQVEKDSVIGLRKDGLEKQSLVYTQINQLIEAEEILLKNYSNEIDVQIRFQHATQQLSWCNTLIEKTLVALKSREVKQMRRASIMQSLNQFSKDDRKQLQAMGSQTIIEEESSDDDSSLMVDSPVTSSLYSNIQSPPALKLKMPQSKLNFQKNFTEQLENRISTLSSKVSTFNQNCEKSSSSTQ